MKKEREAALKKTEIIPESVPEPEVSSEPAGPETSGVAEADQAEPAEAEESADDAKPATATGRGRKPAAASFAPVDTSARSARSKIHWPCGVVKCHVPIS